MLNIVYQKALQMVSGVGNAPKMLLLGLYSCSKHCTHHTSMHAGFSAKPHFLLLSAGVAVLLKDSDAVHVFTFCFIAQFPSALFEQSTFKHVPLVLHFLKRYIKKTIFILFIHILKTLHDAWMVILH